MCKMEGLKSSCSCHEFFGAGLVREFLFLCLRLCCEGEDHVVELNLVGKLHINARSHASGGNQLQCPMFTENVPVSSHVLEDTAYRSYVLLVILGKEKGRACK